MDNPLDSHYPKVLRALCDGMVVPFLGAGANLCGRPPKSPWEVSKYLPNGAELSEHLADRFNYREDDALDTCPACRQRVSLVGRRERQDLARVSQYVALDAGSGPLYYELRNVFAPEKKYPPTPLHSFFARLPARLAAKGYPRRSGTRPSRLVIVTTNYDSVLEDSFRKAGERFHVVSYMADAARPEQRGKCLHWAPDAQPVLIETPNNYAGLLGDRHPVVVKIHGAADHNDAQYDSFVITEDHYIDYLTRANITSLLPTPLPAILCNTHFLFLGYSLRDLNLRVILHLIQRDQKLKYKSWAIQREPQELDRKFWMERNVEIFDAPLEKYIYGLDMAVEAL